jgi:hypothetical protein
MVTIDKDYIRRGQLAHLDIPGTICADQQFKPPIIYAVPTGRSGYFPSLDGK